MLSNKGDNMFDGIINGIAAGLGAGVGVLFSQLVVRPFFAKYINPKYLHLKDQYRRVKYSNDYFRTLTLKELEWVDKSGIILYNVCLRYHSHNSNFSNSRNMG